MARSEARLASSRRGASKATGSGAATQWQIGVTWQALFTALRRNVLFGAHACCCERPRRRSRRCARVGFGYRGWRPMRLRLCSAARTLRLTA
jgi:hypothetical protein